MPHNDFFNAIKKFADSAKVRFFVPGHKGGNGLPSGFKKNFISLDVTEFEETDNLSDPSGIIFHSQKSAAKIFGANKSHFLVNGSTVGIQAMILGTLNPGDRIIVDRNCHKSVIAALVLAGAEPVFVYPEYIARYSMYGGIPPCSIEKLLDGNPDVKGAVITYPTYYGICSDLEKISKILHDRNKFLLVDEAHGAHFKFNTQLPLTALQCGADVSVQSAHKTLPVLTQGAFLHINYSLRINSERIEKCLKLLQTTSPSYLIMNSLAFSVQHMENEGMVRLGELLEACENLRNKLDATGKVYCMGKNIREQFSVWGFDKTRLVINFSRLGLSGEKVSFLLASRYGIRVEMFDKYNIVCVITVGNTVSDIAKLEKALLLILNEESYLIEPIEDLSIPEIKTEIPLCRAFKADWEEVSIRDAEGRICADIVSVCPPGCGVCIPGQIVTTDVIKTLRRMGIDSVKVITYEYIDAFEYEKRRLFEIERDKRIEFVE